MPITKGEIVPIAPAANVIPIEIGHDQELDEWSLEPFWSEPTAFWSQSSCQHHLELEKTEDLSQMDCTVGSSPSRNFFCTRSDTFTGIHCINDSVLMFNPHPPISRSLDTKLQGNFTPCEHLDPSVELQAT